MPYIDAWVLPVPTEKLPEYRKLSRMAAKVWHDHGSLEYREWEGEDLNIEGLLSFMKMAKAKEGETVVFGWAVFKSKAHRDRVNEKVMQDPRMAVCQDPKALPFNLKRMAWGGFKALAGS